MGGNILITGATAGIGKASALDLAKAGFRVFATGRNLNALEQLAKEAGGTRLETIELDVTDRQSIARAAEELNSRTDGYGLDVLVNNAGFGTVAPIIEVAEEEVRAQYETNVFGLLAVTQAFARAMMRRGHGRIINISSLGGQVTLPMFGAYNSTKFAVESLSDALRRELKPFGVSVVIIEPGPIKTEFATRSVKEFEAYKASEFYSKVLERSDEMKVQADKMSASVEVVVKSIRHAVVSSRPRTRYVMPLSTAVFGWFVWLAPTRLVDWVLRSAMGLTRKGLGLDRPRELSAAPSKHEP